MASWAKACLKVLGAKLRKTPEEGYRGRCAGMSGGGNRCRCERGCEVWELRGEVCEWKRRWTRTRWSWPLGFRAVATGVAGAVGSWNALDMAGESSNLVRSGTTFEQSILILIVA
jgi:hypothetical protein